MHDDNPAVTHVCFSPNGRYVLAFNLDGCIRLWDYITHPSPVKKTYQGHANTRFSIGGCFGRLTEGEGGGGDEHGEDDRDRDRDRSPFVAVASEDGDVVLYDVESKAILQRIHAHDAGTVCFWVDVHGDTMVTAGQDGLIRVFRHKSKGKGSGNKRNKLIAKIINGVNGDGDSVTPYPPSEEPDGKRSQVESVSPAREVKQEER